MSRTVLARSRLGKCDRLKIADRNNTSKSKIRSAQNFLLLFATAKTINGLKAIAVHLYYEVVPTRGTTENMEIGTRCKVRLLVGITY
ncbi:hypothetical protein VB735_34605 [Halotia wernerae UHCC 0503]|nr:hypothetical protein [Halotia wernerae UHCC 0503]